MTVAQSAVAMAVSIFNDGASSLGASMEKMGHIPRQKLIETANQSILGIQKSKEEEETTFRRGRRGDGRVPIPLWWSLGEKRLEM